ncbi:MAG: RNA 2',3'-cyclic phosphodiesterase [Candidatus Cryosericum sp.]|nr:RNA 2',3'-cyclic phosphodiesterase [bacterium]
MRAFVGISLPADFADWFHESMEPIRLMTSKLRLVPPESCHVTLRFLGEISREEIGDVVYRLSASLRSVPNTSVSLERFGMFRRNGWPAVLWVGPRAVPEGLRSLAATVSTSLLGLGSNARVDHFEPHVTLGRFAAGTYDQDVASIESMQVKGYVIPVENIVLYESLMGQGRPVYVARAAVSLARFAE